jgi:uncharacterized phage-associated protein
MLKIKDIAKFFILHCGEITLVKLHHLCYYSYAWYLVFFNSRGTNLDNKFFKEQFEALSFGPASPYIDKQYSKYKDNIIPSKLNKYIWKSVNKKIPTELAKFLFKVIEAYADRNDKELTQLSTNEEPYLLAQQRESNLIEDKEIYHYYKLKWVKKKIKNRKIIAK